MRHSLLAGPESHCSRPTSTPLLIALLMVSAQLNGCEVEALRCYDSQSAEPDRTTECASGELCYSEYYALRAANHLLHSAQRRRKAGNSGGPIKHLLAAPPGVALAHFYDRFCVHAKHCIHRGLVPDGNCLGVEQLDAVVQRTFWTKLRMERLEPRRLMFSRFCCCGSADLCNDLRPDTVAATFNFTSGGGAVDRLAVDEVAPHRHRTRFGVAHHNQTDTSMQPGHYGKATRRESGNTYRRNNRDELPSGTARSTQKRNSAVALLPATSVMVVASATVALLSRTEHRHVRV